jgi:DNA-binding transcriptional MerR regulator/uncharacterized glyoxalase superfamily protein PhnB
MNDLIKIKEISSKYNISARTLRYYEDIGLIESIRSDDYAYRKYDEITVKRLEQILILRKLNISIKDIKRVFSAPDSAVVIEVLGKKVNEIDDEAALLYELKEIILEFIQQIKDSDFSKDNDVKKLYEKAKDIEVQLVNIDYDGNPSGINRLLEVTEKLEKKQSIVKKAPYFYIIFDVNNAIEACELYYKAFGAEKTSEEKGVDGWVGITMDVFETQIFVQSFPHWTQKHNEKKYGCICFSSEEDLRKAYDVLIQEGQDHSIHTDWGWTPLVALVTDKFDVSWLFCLQ